MAKLAAAHSLRECVERRVSSSLTGDTKANVVKR